MNPTDGRCRLLYPALVSHALNDRTYRQGRRCIGLVRVRYAGGDASGASLRVREHLDVRPLIERSR